MSKGQRELVLETKTTEKNLAFSHAYSSPWILVTQNIVLFNLHFNTEKYIHI
jgi:hypothetical protein